MVCKICGLALVNELALAAHIDFEHPESHNALRQFGKWQTPALFISYNIHTHILHGNPIQNVDGQQSCEHKSAAAFAGEVDRLIHFKNIYHFSAKYNSYSIGQP